MSESQTTLRPVFVNYTHDAEPDELHPNGVRAGSVFECSSPELADQFHPKAVITRYADGSDFDRRAYLKEVRERDAPAVVEAKAAPKAKTVEKPAQKRSTGSGSTKTTKKTSDTPKRLTAAQKAVQNAKTEVSTTTAIVGEGDDAIAVPIAPAMEPSTEPLGKPD